MGKLIDISKIRDSTERNTLHGNGKLYWISPARSYRLLTSRSSGIVEESKFIKLYPSHLTSHVVAGGWCIHQEFLNGIVQSQGGVGAGQES
jgi:hypothetical protein